MRSNVARPIVDDVAMLRWSSASRMTTPSVKARHFGTGQGGIEMEMETKHKR